MGKRLEIHPQNPQPRLVREVVETLLDGGVIIYPTDTVYAIGCDIQSKKALERVCHIKGIDPEKSRFTCICADLKAMGEYTVHVDTPVYRVLRRAVPGPYVFIFEASKNIPRHFQSRRKTVGIRVSDHPIPQAIISGLGRPIMSSSLPEVDGQPPADPEEIWETYGKLVDIVIDGGWGGFVPSTVLDCTEGEVVVVREGAGSLDIL